MTLRERVIKLVEEKGVMKSFLADKIGIDRSAFSLFIQGRRELKPDRAAKLNEIIDSYYYLPIK